MTSNYIYTPSLVRINANMANQYFTYDHFELLKRTDLEDSTRNLTQITPTIEDLDQIRDDIIMIVVQVDRYSFSDVPSVMNIDEKVSRWRADLKEIRKALKEMYGLIGISKESLAN
ncbi:hypothetical protein NHQ30_010850 [Ciborinia camelliae]|nr:hypothetical protein NHQ30_010850 [Ciborinia camelliae]